VLELCDWISSVGSIVSKKSDKLCYKPFLLTTAVKLMRKHLFNGILTRNDESFRKNV
jgi:hypothetical protein